MHKFPQRFRPALIVSLASSLVSIVLAIGPNWDGRYDPTLAVLTATLIAVVWYTFFTYVAIHRDERTRLDVRVHASSGPRRLYFEIRNRNRDRQVRVILQAELVRGGRRIEVGEDLTGADDSAFWLLPGEEHTSELFIKPPTHRPGSNIGPAVDLPEDAIIPARVTVRWRDDLGEAGVIGPNIYAVSVLNITIQRVQQEAEIARLNAVLNSVAGAA